MRRVVAIVGCWTAMLATVPLAGADVAIMKSGEFAAPPALLSSLREGLAGHAVTEYDVRSGPAEAMRLVTSLSGKPVIFVALGAVSAKAVRDAAPASRLAYAMVHDPEGLGLVGPAHVAGVAFAIPVTVQLASFRALAPRLVRLGVVYDPGAVGKLVEEAVAAARIVRVEIVARPVTSPREVPSALRQILSGPEAVDALWLPPDPMLNGEDARRHLLAAALDARRPVLAFSPTVVAEGALASHSADPASVGAQLAQVVSRLAAGESAQRIGLLVPRGQLTVNGKVVRRLKIEIRDEVRQRATLL